MPAQKHTLCGKWAHECPVSSFRVPGSAGGRLSGPPTREVRQERPNYGRLRARAWDEAGKCYGTPGQRWRGGSARPVPNVVALQHERPRCSGSWPVKAHKMNIYVAFVRHSKEQLCTKCSLPCSSLRDKPRGYLHTNLEGTSGPLDHWKAGESEMAGPSGTSAEASGRNSFEETGPSDSLLPVCPLVLAQLRAVICRCGNPLECIYTPFKVPCHPTDGNLTPCTTPCGQAKPPNPVAGSNTDSPASDVLCSVESFDPVAADAQVHAQAVRTLAGGSRACPWSAKPPSCSDGNPLCTSVNHASSCSNSSVRTISVYQRACPDLHAPAQGVSMSGLSPRGNDGADAAVPQQFPAKTLINLLCCTRWKHSLRSTSHQPACTAISDVEAGKAGNGSGRARLCSAGATFEERGVVCGLLLYDGQRFLEGRLLYKQLNGNLCWNEAAWKRLYHTLTADVLPNPSEGSAADAVCRTAVETHRKTASLRQLPKTSSSSCTSAGHGDRTFVVLHLVDNRRPKNMCTTPCVTVPSQNLRMSVGSGSLHETEKEGAYTEQESLSRHRLRRLQCSSVYSARVETSSAVPSSGSGSGDNQAEPRTSCSEGATTSATNDRASMEIGRSRATRLRQNSGSAPCDNPGPVVGKPDRVYVPTASSGQSAGAYTLSLVMQLGAAPCAMYARLTEPIRLQPLPLASGVAKLTAAVLLMQRLHAQEQQKLHEQYSACVEALHSITEDMAAAAAQQQKREDILLEGACKILNEKKRKLQALQQRITFLENKLEKAGLPDDSWQSTQRGVSQRQCCGASVLTARDHGATTHTSETGFTGLFRPSTSGGAPTSNGAAPTRRVRNSSSAGLAVAHSQKSTGPSPGTSSRKRTVNSRGTLSERPSNKDDRAKCQLQDKHPGGLFLVENKRLFPAAFACIHVKEETLQA